MVTTIDTSVTETPDRASAGKGHRRKAWRRTALAALLALSVTLGGLVTAATPASADGGFTIYECLSGKGYFPPMPTVKRGDRGQYVACVQYFLRGAAWVAQDLQLHPGPVDGIFGARTESAVIRYQARLAYMGHAGVNNIDGIVGDTTKNWIFLDCGVIKVCDENVYY